jgi:hypothetical protein
MSDNWITITPDDPNFIPEETQRINARNRLMEIAHKFDEVKIVLSDHISFFDCGSNFDRIGCPNCKSDLPGNWWHEIMNSDFENGTFKLDKYLTPCCNYSFSVNELIYDWTQGFGKFAIRAMNPDIGTLEEKYKLELEDILGTKLTVIYGHF